MAVRSWQLVCQEGTIEKEIRMTHEESNLIDLLRLKTLCFESAGNGVIPVFELAKLEREVLDAAEKVVRNLVKEKNYQFCWETPFVGTFASARKCTVR